MTETDRHMANETTNPADDNPQATQATPTGAAVQPGQVTEAAAAGRPAQATPGGAAGVVSGNF